MKRLLKTIYVIATILGVIVTGLNSIELNRLEQPKISTHSQININ